MLRRWVLASLFLWSAIGAAQVAGKFYLEKQTYSPGEPVFLYFEVTNNASVDQFIPQTDPNSFCAGFAIRVLPDARTGYGCDPQGGFASSCLSSPVLLPTGKSRIERVLLNYDHPIDAAGEYDIEAFRSLPYSETQGPYFPSTTATLEVRKGLHFRVDENSSFDPAGLKSFVGQLHSEDRAERLEAARTLASVAPSSLETTLLGFSENEEFKSFAPLALHKLNTKRSMAALAGLLVKEPAGNEQEQAARFLARSGNPEWTPLLLELARKKPQFWSYVAYAAQSAGEKSLPLLVELLQSPDTVENAVSGLGSTGTRTAVPILLTLLRNPDHAIASRALSSLTQLTHRNGPGQWGPDAPQSQYDRWASWWSQSQSTARIYKASECGDYTALP